MHARGGLGGIERGCTRRDAERSESRFRGDANRLLRQRMRQLLECRITFERVVRSFIRFDENKDARGGADCARMRRSSLGFHSGL